MTTLREAAQSFIDSWDSGRFFTDFHAERIAALRAALAQPAQEPLFLLHTGEIASDGEQDEWDCEADSGKRVEEFCLQHPGQTIPLYAHPPQDDTAALRAEVRGRMLVDPADLAAYIAQSREQTEREQPRPAARLTVDNIWGNDEIMALNSRFGLLLLDLVALADAVQRAFAAKNGLEVGDE